MAKAFLDPQRDVPLRLSRTICFWKNEPYYVTNIGDRIRRGEDPPRNIDWKMVTLTPVTDPNNYSRAEVVDYTLDDFSWEMPTLGYANSPKQAVYVMRTPARIQKKGLCAEGCTLAGDGAPPMGDIFYSKAMVRMLKGEYPTIQHAFRRVMEGEAESMAFHRDVAFEDIGSQVIGLKFKGRLVGVREFDDTFNLFKSPEASILKKFIGDTGVKV